MSTPQLRVAIYARVSTRDRGQDTLNQLVQLRVFADKQGWSMVSEFIDHESGGRSDRAEFQRMFADASRRKFDLLLFWSLDRLSREGVLPTLKHLERLTAYNVAWRSFTEQYFDSCGPFRDAVIAILAALARQEKIRISERTRAGLAIARAKGRQIGRPRLKVQLTEIKRLKATGMSLRGIARQLLISEGSVRRLIRSSAA
jgi:DNA invertase Pin-like site-specific DNA recombinase